jgi:hypothetical protein
MTDLGKCLWCGGDNPPSKPGKGRKRKYCSKPCASKYLGEQEKKKHPRYNDPTWKQGSKIRKAEQERKKLEYEKHVNSPDWIRLEDIAKAIGIKTTSGAWNAAKVAGIEPKKVQRPDFGTYVSFYKRSDLAKITEYRGRGVESVIPEGYITTRQFAERIGITLSTFQSMRSKSHPSLVAKALRRIKWDRKVSIPAGGRIPIWKESCVDDYIKFRKEEQDKSKAARLAKRLAKEEAIAKEQAAYEKAIEGKLTSEEVVAKLGLVHMTPNWMNRLSPQKIKGRHWFDPEDVDRAIAQKDLEYSLGFLQRINRPAPPHNTVVSKLQAHEAYQLRIRNDWETIGPKYPKRIKSHRASHRIGLVKKAWEDEANGNVLHMDCRMCDKNLPFTHFWVDLTYKTGFRSKCMYCETEQRIQKQKSKPKSAKKTGQARKQKFINTFVTSIKQSLSKRNNTYIHITTRYVWHEIEKHLGYNKQDFIDHIDKQIAASNWMTYDNWGKPKFPGDKKWQLDHTKPRSSFRYKKISDESFKQCWSLNNLKPLEARMNMIKSDKKMRVTMRSSFISGLKKFIAGKKTKNSGVWRFLDYGPAEVKKHIESQFRDDMNWSNHGTVWQIDHIVPQAALPYSDPYCDNFKKCWSKENFQPLYKSDNSTKSSVYQDIMHHYNDK